MAPRANGPMRGYLGSKGTYGDKAIHFSLMSTFTWD